MTFHVNTNPLEKSPERAFALQKYLLLHSQHDALQKRLQAISSVVPSVEPDINQSHHHTESRNSSFSSTSSSEFDSTSISPISESSPEHTVSRTARPSLGRPRRSSLPATMSTFDTAGGLTCQEREIEEEETKLMDVNLQIKSTLTELLNCESVRGDLRYARWCQEKLMDVERELKGGKRESVLRRRGSIAF